MLAIPPFGASSNIALWRANIKPPVELVVDDLENRGGFTPVSSHLVPDLKVRTQVSTTVSVGAKDVVHWITAPR